MNRDAPLVIGSGLSSLGACHALIQAGIRPIVVDIGTSSPVLPNSGREKLLLGETAAHLQNLDPRFSAISPILNLPAFHRLVTSITTPEKDGTFVVESSARGGLATAWGGGSFRFNDEDLAGFPFTENEIANAYDEIGSLLNVSWSRDSLLGDLGEERTEPDTASYSKTSTAVLEKFNRNRRGRSETLALGRPRLAMHPSWAYSQALDNLHPETRSFFNPRIVFDSWVRENKIDYRPGLKVIKISETKNITEVVCENIANSETMALQASRVFLAAGTIASARVICQSLGLSSLKRPILDNPGLILPFFFYGKIPADHPATKPRIPTFQLSAIYSHSRFRGRIIANFLDMSQLSISELIRYLPLPLPAHFHFQKILRERILISYNFFPCEPENAGQLRIESGATEVIPPQIDLRVKDVNPLANSAFSFGLMPLKLAAKKLPFGSSIHYAGTFAHMPAGQISDDEFRTDRDGRLRQFHRVHLVDGSTFPRLPAKNFSMTLMANAYRIARKFSNSDTSTMDGNSQ